MCELTIPVSEDTSLLVGLALWLLFLLLLAILIFFLELFIRVMLFVLQKNFVFFACLFVSVLALLDRVYDLLNFAVDQHTRGILVLLCAVARRVVDVAGRKDELVLLLEMLRVSEEEWPSRPGMPGSWCSWANTEL